MKVISGWLLLEQLYFGAIALHSSKFVLIRGDPFIMFAERGRVPKSKRSKRGCVNLVLWYSPKSERNKWMLPFVMLDCPNSTCHDPNQFPSFLTLCAFLHLLLPSGEMVPSHQRLLSQFQSKPLLPQHLPSTHLLHPIMSSQSLNYLSVLQLWLQASEWIYCLKIVRNTCFFRILHNHTCWSRPIHKKGKWPHSTWD